MNSLIVDICITNRSLVLNIYDPIGNMLKQLRIQRKGFFKNSFHDFKDSCGFLTYQLYHICMYSGVKTVRVYRMPNGYKGLKAFIISILIYNNITIEYVR